MKVVLLAVLLTSSSALFPATAQRTWQVQSPCDNNFSVELPVPLYQVSWFEGKHGPSLEADEKFDKGGAAYVALQGAPKRQFGVVVQDIPVKDRAEYRKGEFGGTYFVIGGDDATPTSEKVVHANGLTGRELCMPRKFQKRRTLEGESSTLRDGYTLLCLSAQRQMTSFRRKLIGF